MTIEQRLQLLEAETQTLSHVAAISVARLEWLIQQAAQTASPEALADLEHANLATLFEVLDSGSPRDAAMARQALVALGLTAPDYVPADFA